MKTIPRRTFLAASGLGAASLMTGLGTQISLAQAPTTGDKLVVIHLRGGADGLSMTPPYGYSSYHDHRPNTDIAEPGQSGGALPLTSASANGQAVFPTGLDGVVGMHPALEPIHSALWSKGQLAVVVGAGLPNATRSHFAAERYVNRGGVKGSIAQGGWVGRLSDSLPASGPVSSAHAKRSNALVGGSNTVQLLDGLNRFGLDGYRDRNSHKQRTLARTALAAMYAGGGDSVSASGATALDVIEKVSDLNTDRSTAYPADNGYGSALKETATLFESDLNIHSAAMRRGAWDHHKNLKAGFAEQATELATGVRAFIDDTDLQGITLMVVTEFGRTVGENSGGGTDHGLGFTALVMGAGIRGGVFGDDYPDTLDSGKRPELPVLTDYRKIASEVISERIGSVNLNTVFPDYRQNGVLGLAR